MASKKVRYPAATAVVHALPCLQRTDMDGVGLVSRELHKEVEASPVRRASFLRLRRDELTGWECACSVTCQCEGAPATERVSVEGTFTGLVEVFKHALRHSSVSISFVELHFRDVLTALSGVATKSSVFALEFYAVDFSEHSADEFHKFAFASGELRTLKLDNRCAASHDYLTDSFLRACVEKELVEVTFENILSDADWYGLTDKGILDFISYDAGRDDRRCLYVAAAKVSQNFFKRLVQVTTLEEGLGRAKVAGFSIELQSVICDEQDLGDYEGYEELYATNESDSCTHPSDVPWNCIGGILIALISSYILVV